MAAVIVNGALGTFFAIGSAGLWKTRGVWGWWVVPTGLGLWAAFFADFHWVAEKIMEKMEESGILDEEEVDEEEEEEEEEQDENEDDEDDEDENDEDEDQNMLPSLLWVND